MLLCTNGELYKITDEAQNYLILMRILKVSISLFFLVLIASY